MSAERKDIIVTWPKTRPLASYLAELAKAKSDGCVINYRVPHLPDLDPGSGLGRESRCYMVHDGFVRGWCEILATTYRGPREVRDTVTGGFWSAGSYIVRDPTWHAVHRIPMRGFQGWRYFDGSLAKDCK